MSKEDNELFTPSPDEANTDKKEKSERPKKKRAATRKGDVFTADDCTAKIFQLYNLTGKMLKTDGKMREKDFVEEGAALSRLTEKYPIVSFVMKMLDPVFFALGTFNKFNTHFSEFTARKKQEKIEKKLADAGGQVPLEIVQNHPTQL